MILMYSRTQVFHSGDQICMDVTINDSVFVTSI